jgi:hypothetical protein
MYDLASLRTLWTDGVGYASLRTPNSGYGATKVGVRSGAIIHIVRSFGPSVTKLPHHSRLDTCLCSMAVKFPVHTALISQKWGVRTFGSGNKMTLRTWWMCIILVHTGCLAAAVSAWY